MMKETTHDTNILGHKFNRRSMLTGTGRLALMAAATTAATSMAGGAQAGTTKIGQQVFTVLYPRGEGITFNFEYYRDHHLKTIMKLYAGLIDRFELRKGTSGPDGSSPSQYIAVVNIYVADPKGFAEANEKYRDTLVADVPNFTNGQPYIQVDEIFAIAEK
jgi:uncharacterized protein (TIGR02118 family)